jgi:hypothetical protein
MHTTRYKQACLGLRTASLWKTLSFQEAQDMAGRLCTVASHIQNVSVRVMPGVKATLIPSCVTQP